MKLPEITEQQIHDRCTEQSYSRGLDYFLYGAIENPILIENTLISMCEGSEYEPYIVTVKFRPKGIASTDCSCPYDYEGDCKHIIALLLTYTESFENIDILNTLFDTLALKPKSTLLQIITDMLKRYPDLASILQNAADL